MEIKQYTTEYLKALNPKQVNETYFKKKVTEDNTKVELCCNICEQPLAGKNSKRHVETHIKYFENNFHHYFDIHPTIKTKIVCKRAGHEVLYHKAKQHIEACEDPGSRLNNRKRKDASHNAEERHQGAVDIDDDTDDIGEKADEGEEIIVKKIKKDKGIINSIKIYTNQVAVMIYESLKPEFKVEGITPQQKAARTRVQKRLLKTTIEPCLEELFRLIDRLGEEIKKLRNENEELKKQNTEVTQRNMELEDEIKHKEQMLEELRAEVKKIEEERKKDKMAIDHLVVEQDKLRKEQQKSNDKQMKERKGLAKILQGLIANPPFAPLVETGNHINDYLRPGSYGHLDGQEHQDDQGKFQ